MDSLGCLTKIIKCKMPIPKPKPAEKQSDFMIRCVPMLTPYHEKSQAIAICYDKFKNKTL